MIEELLGALHFVVILLACAGTWAGVRGAKLLVRGFCCPDDVLAPLWVVRGIRGVVAAVGAGALAGGLLFAQTWLMVFGVIFLAEELYETGVLALILRAGLRRAQ